MKNLLYWQSLEQRLLEDLDYYPSRYLGLSTHGMQGQCKSIQRKAHAQWAARRRIGQAGVAKRRHIEERLAHCRERIQALQDRSLWTHIRKGGLEI